MSREEAWGHLSQTAWDALPEGMYSTNGERSAFDDGYRAAQLTPSEVLRRAADIEDEEGLEREDLRTLASRLEGSKSPKANIGTRKRGAEMPQEAQNGGWVTPSTRKPKANHQGPSEPEVER